MCRQESYNVDAFNNVFDDANDNASDNASSTTMTFQAVFKKQIDVFVEEGLDFVLCEVAFLYIQN